MKTEKSARVTKIPAEPLCINRSSIELTDTAIRGRMQYERARHLYGCSYGGQDTRWLEKGHVVVTL